MFQFVLTLAMGLLALSLSARAVDRPNILIILLDDSDYEYPARFGHPAAYTPNLDQILADGCVFRIGYTMPVCRPSIASLISGRYPDEHSIRSNDSPGRLNPTGSIALRLKEAGSTHLAAGNSGSAPAGITTRRHKVFWVPDWKGGV